MATKTLVEFPLEAGRNLVEALEAKGLQLIAAFWQFQPDEEKWLANRTFIACCRRSKN